MKFHGLNIRRLTTRPTMSRVSIHVPSQQLTVPHTCIYTHMYSEHHITHVCDCDSDELQMHRSISVAQCGYVQSDSLTTDAGGTAAVNTATTTSRLVRYIRRTSHKHSVPRWSTTGLHLPGRNGTRAVNKSSDGQQNYSSISSQSQTDRRRQQGRRHCDSDRAMQRQEM